MTKLSVGFIATRSQTVHKKEATEIIRTVFDKIAKENTGNFVEILFEYVDEGVPKIAFELAKQRGWHTVVVAPERERLRRNFPSDKVDFIPENIVPKMGPFLRRCNHLIRVGDDSDALEAVKMAKERGIPVHEYELSDFGVPSKLGQLKRELFPFLAFQAVVYGMSATYWFLNGQYYISLVEQGISLPLFTQFVWSTVHFNILNVLIIAIIGLIVAERYNAYVNMK